MGKGLYTPHGTANRNGRSPATRAAGELRDVRGRGGDRGPRRGPLGCLGGVRLAAALGRRCRRGLHRGRECPQRCVRPGNGPGEPSGTPAPRREGERAFRMRSEEHTSELQSLTNLVCRLLLEKKKQQTNNNNHYYIETVP